jgi:hypothetical protein
MRGNCQRFSLADVLLHLKQSLCCSVPPLYMYIYELHVVLTRDFAFTRRSIERDETPALNVGGTTVVAVSKGATWRSE